jgi:autotransporter-associated beta strand protein
LLFGLPVAAQSVPGSSIPSGTSETQSSAPITDGTTPTNVSVSGGGVFVLNNNLNSYSGGTFVYGGSTLQFDNDSELGALSGGITLGDSSTTGALLATNTSGQSSSRSIVLNAGGGVLAGSNPGTVFTYNGVISGSGGLSVLGSNTVVQVTNTNNSYTGGTTIAGGATLQFSNDAQLGAASGGITLGDGTNGGTLFSTSQTSMSSARNITLNAGGGNLVGSNSSALLTYSGVISGSGGLTIFGPNTFVYLSNATSSTSSTYTGNTYTGGTVVAGGATLQVDDDSELGYFGNITLGDASGSKPGTLYFPGTTNYITQRTVTLNTGGGILMGNSLSYEAEFDGVIQGSGNLTITGPNTLVVMNGANTYTGNTLVTNGAHLGITGDASLGTSNLLTLDSGSLEFDAAGVSVAHNVAVTSGTGTINTNGNNAVMTGSVYSVTDSQGNQGSFVKTGTGNLTLENSSNIIGGGTTVNEGTLQIGDYSNPSSSLTSNVQVTNLSSGGTVSGQGALGGVGTINGNVTNTGCGDVANSGCSATAQSGGLIVPGTLVGAYSVGTLTVNGSFTQTPTGTLLAEISPVGVTQLKVNGTAQLAGTIDLTYGSGYLHPGTYTLFSANSATFQNLNIVGLAVPSVGLSSKLVEQNDMIDVVLTQLTSLPQYPTVYPALTAVAVNEAQRMNGVLLTHMEDVRLAAMSDGLFGALSPYHRMRGDAPYGFWFTPLGSGGTESGNNGASGFYERNYGGVFGFDTEVGKGFSAGGMLAFDRATASENVGGARGSVEVPHLDLYGTWWRGPFAVDLTMGVGLPQFRADRPIAMAPELAKSGHSGTELTSSLQGSYATMLGDWNVSAATGAKYLAMEQTEFTEYQSTIYNFAVDRHYSESLRPFVQVEASRRFELGTQFAITPQLKATYEAEMANPTRNITAQTEGDAYNWAIAGVVPGRNMLDMSATVLVETSKAQSFYMTYDRVQSSTDKEDAVSAGIRYRL